MNGKQALAVAMIVMIRCVTCAAESPPVKHLGARRELFVDHYLIDSITGAKLTLHAPIPREVAIVHDMPWEGNTCWSHTIFHDGDLFRMYYRASHYDPVAKKRGEPSIRGTAYAESRDGIHWTKPKLGLVEFKGSSANNLIFPAGQPTISPFLDANPACKPDERYKAVAGDSSGTETSGLYVFKSPDGIHWSPIREKQVMQPTLAYQFDSQDVAFWDIARSCYVLFSRASFDGVRNVISSTSADFIHWTDPIGAKFPGAPSEQLYHNAIVAYYRAPHIYMGFPNRYLMGNRKVVADPWKTGLNDSLYMTSRDGVSFHRWPEAHIRPGREKDSWTNRSMFTATGILVTKSAIDGAPDELSIYCSSGYARGKSCQLRRFTTRIDGFVSVKAPASGGELLTEPLTFEGSQLVLNFATSAAGSVQVEILDAQGKPIENFALRQCTELYGDEIERVVSWQDGNDVSKLAGQPIRLRFVLHDADLYSMRFRP